MVTHACTGSCNRSIGFGIGCIEWIRPTVGNSGGQPGAGHSLFHRCAFPEMEAASSPGRRMHIGSPVRFQHYCKVAAIWIIYHLDHIPFVRHIAWVSSEACQDLLAHPGP